MGQCVDPSGRAAYGVDLQPFACWDCGFESRWGHGCLSLASVLCCQVEVSASGWSLVQRSPTECTVSECDREASIMKRPWPTGGCCAVGKNGLKQGDVPSWAIITEEVANYDYVTNCFAKCWVFLEAQATERGWNGAHEKGRKVQTLKAKCKGAREKGRKVQTLKAKCKGAREKGRKVQTLKSKCKGAREKERKVQNLKIEM
jgi:hypothetical protein